MCLHTRDAFVHILNQWDGSPSPPTRVHQKAETKSPCQPSRTTCRILASQDPSLQEGAEMTSLWDSQCRVERASLHQRCGVLLSKPVAERPATLGSHRPRTGGPQLQSTQTT